MARADANRTALRYDVETSWGYAPGPYTEVRFTGESLAFNVSNIQSTEIRDDRQVTDLIQTGADTSGGFNFELSYGAFDDFLLASLWGSAWSDAIAAYKTSLECVIGTVTSQGYISTLAYDNLGGASGTFVTGQFIELSGFSATGTTADSNDIFFITGCRATGLNVVPPPAVATTSTNNGTALGIMVKGQYIRNGVTETSFSMERKHGDVEQFFLYSGMVVNALNITATANSIVTGSFDFIGKTVATAATHATGVSVVAASSSDVMNAVSNVGRILEGATLATIADDLFIQEISFAVANNVRGINAIGTLGNVDVGVGNFEVTGTMNTYFKDADLYAKYVAGTETGLSFKIEDASGNNYIFTFPRIKFETDALNTSGQNTDVMENVGWRAIRHATYDCMMQIDKMPA